MKRPLQIPNIYALMLHCQHFMNYAIRTRKPLSFDIVFSALYLSQNIMPECMNLFWKIYVFQLLISKINDLLSSRKKQIYNIAIYPSDIGLNILNYGKVFYNGIHLLDFS